MSDCDHMCTKCDRKSCIEFKPKMAFPRELQTDYETMITANLLMATSIESLKCKNDQLQAENAKLREEIEAAKHDLQVFSMGSVQLDAENAKLRELCADIYEMAYHEYPSAFEAAFSGRMRDLGIEVTR